MVPSLVLSALDAYISFIFQSDEDIEPMKGLLESIEQEIFKISTEMAAGDFDAA